VVASPEHAACLLAEHLERGADAAPQAEPQQPVGDVSPGSPTYGHSTPAVRIRRSHATIGAASKQNWVTRCRSNPRSRAIRHFASSAR
jgi:hypothetical protein